MNPKPLMRSSRGFTLMEIVIGMTVFAIVLSIITGILAPQATRSIDPIYQVRATEIAQSMLNEMSGKLFDEYADRNGGRIRCNEDLNGNGNATDTSVGERVCTQPLQLGPEDGGGGRFNDGERRRDDFDDIDDYHGLSFASGADFQNSLGETLEIDGTNLYEGFQMSVSVVYDSGQDGGADNASGPIKRVDITVTTPNEQEIYFTYFKHNF